MDDDWPTRRLVARGVIRGAVLEVETLRELEVELDRRALEGPTERITDGDVDLGSVERAVSGVQIPLARVLLVEGSLQLLLGK